MASVGVCNCCGSTDWEYAFTERGIDLGRCRACGLYYIAEVPKAADRVSEVAQGRFASGQTVANSEAHLGWEELRIAEMDSYIALAKRFAPHGTWIDVGCGTGTLINRVQKAGIDIEGIELTRERRARALELTSTTIYDRTIEELKLPEHSFAGVFLIYVFSHLTNPMETFQEINRILKPGGILLMKTSEIGPGAKKEHVFDWLLGDHIYFLGENTIERYAAQTGFELVHRERHWQPDIMYSREHFQARGRSRLRNMAKSMILVAPRALSLLRWYMLNKRHNGNPVYTSTLVLQKLGTI